MSALVSVVIPTYNRAADLQRALASVVGQTWRNWEVLVVDNHSTDNTAEVVAGFNDSRIRLLLVHNHGVIGASRNLGVRNAAGSYISFLDSDDWWTSDKLAQSVACCEAGADLVYHDLYLVWSRQQRLFWRRRGTRELTTPAFDDLVLNGNAMCNSSVVVRRDLFMDMGGFSEDRLLIAWEDYDAWLRIAKITERFARLPRTLGYYWVGGGNTSSSERLLRNYEQFKQRYLVPEPRWRDRPMPAWCDYGIGLAYHQLGDHRPAFEHLRRAIRGPLPPVSRLKVLWTAAVSLGHRVAHTLRAAQ